MAKIIIDSEKVEELFESNWKWEGVAAAFYELVDKEGTVLPDNATNGDMIKAIYPNCVIEEDFSGAVVTRIDNTQYWRKKWWNSTYKGGNE